MKAAQDGVHIEAVLDHQRERRDLGSIREHAETLGVWRAIEALL